MLSDGGGRFYWSRQHRTAEEARKGIVVVFAWVSICETQLENFANLYSSLGWDSLVCLADFLNPWVNFIAIVKIRVLFFTVLHRVLLLTANKLRKRLKKRKFQCNCTLSHTFYVLFTHFNTFSTSQWAVFSIFLLRTLEDMYIMCMCALAHSRFEYMLHFITNTPMENAKLSVKFSNSFINGMIV